MTRAEDPAQRERLAWLVLSLAAALAPFVTIDIPPCTDLPQHVAQARLFFEALGDPTGPYRIQWLTPYSLSYWPLFLLWLGLPPMLVGKLHLLLIVVACTLTVHLLAARRGRPPEAAALASLFVFSHPLYWGFLSFLVGFPAFVWWLIVLEREPDAPRRDLGRVLVAAALLYLSHALWFAVGLVWLALHTRSRRDLRRWLPVLPLCALAAWQSSQFSSGRFAMAPVWSDWPAARFAGVVDAALGGLRGPIEPIVVGFAAAWIAAGLATRRGQGLDRRLAAAGLLLALLFAVLPIKYLNTMSFAQRWLPFAAVFLLVGAPAPRLPALARRLLGGALVVAFAAATTVAWRGYQRDDVDGLEQSIDALPQRPRVLGLVLIRGSERFKPHVTLQAFAWAQVARGGSLNFSFAEHPASPVVYRARFRPPWTDGLEWRPEDLQPRDLAYFDFALVSADDRLHALFGSLPGVRAVTSAGRWRLYRLVAPSGSG